MTSARRKEESKLFQWVQRRASEIGWRLFRNNTGLGWVGQTVRIRERKAITLDPGDLVIRNARPLKAGLIEGGSDGIGWAPILIEPKHVGRTFAVFVALETKSSTGELEPEQIVFLNNARKAGAIASEIRSEQDAEIVFRSAQ